MNHLAHAFLAADSPESLIGNLAGDFFKGPVSRHDLRLQEGIRLHRRVDEFTDTHPAVRASKRRIAQEHGHYSGIIVDVFYDHLLAVSWQRFSTETLENFAQRVYSTLEQYPELVPPAFAVSLPRMISDDWLVRYRSIEGVSRALYFLSRRLRNAPRLDQAIPLLESQRGELEQDFAGFFPELVSLRNSE
ncbi:MAG TPA: ACP phosphodiesterase [Thermoanaerobaculia bacterium]|nr:ACP phosphodiesterase [Thermoanaerobaculia bacterium]